MMRSTTNGEPTEQPPQGVFGVFKTAVRVAFFENAALKVVALVLALTGFVLVQSVEKDVSQYHPRVQITYSQDLNRVLISKRVDTVQISVRGTRRRIKRLQREPLGINIDTDTLNNGEKFLDAEMFDLPEGVEFVSANPPSIYFEFDEKIQKFLDVNVDTIGLPARGFRLGSLGSSPSKVQVTGGRKKLEDTDDIFTQKVNLTGRTQSYAGKVQLLAEGFEIQGSPEVDVTVNVIEDLQKRELKDKRIEIRAPEGLSQETNRFRVLPQKVSVTMVGALNTLDAISADKVQVYIEFTARDLIAEQPREAEIKVEPKISDIVYDIVPSTVTLKAK